MPAPFSHGASLTMHAQRLGLGWLLAQITTAGNVAVQNIRKISRAPNNMLVILLTMVLQKAVIQENQLLALATPTIRPLLDQSRRAVLGIPVEKVTKRNKLNPPIGGFFYLYCFGLRFRFIRSSVSFLLKCSTLASLSFPN